MYSLVIFVYTNLIKFLDEDLIQLRQLTSYLFNEILSRK